MISLMIMIFAGALSGQTPDTAQTPRQQTPLTAGDTARAGDEGKAMMEEMLGLMGACEAQLPGPLIAAVTFPFSPAALNDATEAQRTRVAPMAAAYAAGKASPRANTLTQQQCSEELEAVSTQMQALSERLGS